MTIYDKVSLYRAKNVLENDTMHRAVYVGHYEVSLDAPLEGSMAAH